jgi:hypothetical protein
MDGTGGDDLSFTATDDSEFALLRRQIFAPVDATFLTAREPCRDCRHRDRCGLQLLACRAFLGFVETGASTHQRGAHHRPTRQLFDRLFPPPPARTTVERYGGIDSGL